MIESVIGILAPLLFIMIVPFVLFIKRRKNILNKFLFSFRNDGYLTDVEYSRYVQAYNAFALAQINIFRLPKPEEISYSLQNSEYARFYKKSSRIMKFFLLYFAIGFVMLLILALVRDFYLR